MSATIPLAKGYDADKLEFPVFVSVKHDGVPIRIDIAPTDEGFDVGVQSRQGKPVPSVEYLVNAFIQRLLNKGVDLTAFPRTFVAEVTHEVLMDFKDISGVVRRDEPQHDLILNFFDFVMHTDERRSDPFFIRQMHLSQILAGIEDKNMQFVHQRNCSNAAEVEQFTSGNLQPEQEGWIVRSHNAKWEPGKRHWGYQKHVQDPTVDLKIVGFEEATAEDGTPKGMVGRVWAEYILACGEVTTIGIGPGKLTHAERIALWNDGLRNGPRIATIKYKRDPSYTALRQPTFQTWRFDKTEPSYE